MMSPHDVLGENGDGFGDVLADVVAVQNVPEQLPSQLTAILLHQGDATVAVPPGAQLHQEGAEGLPGQPHELL